MFQWFIVLGGMVDEVAKPLASPVIVLGQPVAKFMGLNVLTHVELRGDMLIRSYELKKKVDPKFKS